MNVRFLEIARIELDQAVSYYNSESPGLGDAFLLELVAAIDRIGRFPDGWHPIGTGLRRCRLTRFPYGIIYSHDRDEVLVVAVAHLRREPDYWRDRLTR